MPVGLPWTWRLDVRKSFLALAAMIAAAACTDTTSPATPPSKASVDSVAAPAINASLAPSTAFSGYSPTSHHWTHIKTFMTDYYYSWTSAERAWAGAHYDVAMSGSIPDWKAANATVQHLSYALLWTTTVSGTVSLATGYTADMATWFKAHPQYSL